MKQQVQKGFTLIELVVVIVILGILAAVALPRFVDLRGDAANAAAQGVAGSIASATAINFAARSAGNAGAIVLNQAEVCTDVILEPLLTGVDLVAGAPAGNDQFQIGGNGDCTAATGLNSVICTVTAQGGAAQNATVICAR